MLELLLILAVVVYLVSKLDKHHFEQASACLVQAEVRERPLEPVRPHNIRDIAVVEGVLWLHRDGDAEPRKARQVERAHELRVLNRARRSRRRASPSRTPARCSPSPSPPCGSSAAA